LIFALKDVHCETNEVNFGKYGNLQKMIVKREM